MWNVLEQIPNIKIESKHDLECVVKIFQHDPLDRIHCYYKCQNRLWTKDYILHFSITKKVEIVDGIIYIIYKNGQAMWRSARKELQCVVQELNDNYILESKLSYFLELGGNVRLQIKNSVVYIQLSMLPGCISRLLIPPAVHFVLPNKEEILLAFQIIQILQCILF